MNDFTKLAALCQGKHVYIQTHNFPDPDAIASAFGLQRLLALYDVQSTLCYDGRIDKLSASKMLEAFQIQMFSYEQLRPNMAEEELNRCLHKLQITSAHPAQGRCISWAAPASWSVNVVGTLMMWRRLRRCTR